jgi:hypothetical protein
MGFRITAPGNPTQVIGPITTVAGATPAVTAATLAALIAAPYTATVSVNPPGFTDPLGNRSADIVVTLPGDVVVTIDQEISSDPRQVLAVGRPNPASLQGFGDNFLIGSIEQRALLKTYDTGDDRVDVFVVQTIDSGDRGQAMMNGLTVDPARPGIAPVRFSLFVIAAAMNASDKNFATLPHEMGHVVMDVIHAIGDRRDQQLMRNGTSEDIAENATKRIKERPQRFDTPAGAHRQIDHIHQDGAGLLEPV